MLLGASLHAQPCTSYRLKELCRLSLILTLTLTLIDKPSHTLTLSATLTLACTQIVGIDPPSCHGAPPSCPGVLVALTLTPTLTLTLTLAGTPRSVIPCTNSSCDMLISARAASCPSCG